MEQQTTARTKWRQLVFRLVFLLATASVAAWAWASRRRVGSGRGELAWSDSSPISVGAGSVGAGSVAPVSEPAVLEPVVVEPDPIVPAPVAPPSVAEPKAEVPPVDGPQAAGPTVVKPVARPAAAKPKPAKPKPAAPKPSRTKSIGPVAGGENSEPTAETAAKPSAGRSKAEPVAPATAASGEPQGLFETATDGRPGPYPGSALPLDDGAAPSPEFIVKGNAGSKLCHSPGSPYYGRTRAEVWFRTEEDALAAGFRPWTRKK